MWLCTKDGFFSITRVPGSMDKSQLRARSKRHLLNLKATARASYGLIDRAASDEVADASIVQKPHGDYKHRIFLSPETVTQVVSMYGSLIDYGNFKDAVDSSQQSCDDDEYYNFLNSVWSMGFRMED